MNRNCQTGIHCADCKGQPDVMAALRVEKCEGPFTPSQQTKSQVYGPGSILAGLFQTLGFQQGGGCGCAVLQAKMDAWGVEGCREHQDEILDFLEAKAKAQGIPFARIAARVALETAILKAKGLTEESRQMIDPVRRNAG